MALFIVILGLNFFPSLFVPCTWSYNNGIFKSNDIISACDKADFLAVKLRSELAGISQSSAFLKTIL